MTMQKIYIADIRTLTCVPPLSPFRSEKAAAFKNETARLLSLAASCALDRALKDYGLCEKDMRYGEGGHGKPYFTNSPLHFGISHSGSYACASVSETEIGLDIQKISKNDPRVAEKVFGIGETASSEEEFTILWTRRESAGKLMGTGLIGIKDADISGIHFETVRLDGAYLTAAKNEPFGMEIIFT